MTLVRVDLRIFTEPQQGATYDDLLPVARCAEETGFGGFFRSDHYLAMGEGVTGLPGPTDAWVTLAGLARETAGIRIGTLMTAATFRHPASLAVTIAQVDQMSGGRVEVGIGTGWYEAEHVAQGIPFPPSAQRFDVLGEQLEILHGWWSTPIGASFTHDGEHYRVLETPALPKPEQTPHPPVIVGGTGPRRTPALAARFADEFNVPFADTELLADRYARVDAACRERGRDPGELVRSTAQVLCAGRDDAELARRADAIGRDPGELRANGLAGSPEQIVDKLGHLARDTGVQRVYLQVLDLADLAHLELVASEVLPHM